MFQIKIWQVLFTRLKSDLYLVRRQEIYYHWHGCKIASHELRKQIICATPGRTFFLHVYVSSIVWSVRGFWEVYVEKWMKYTGFIFASAVCLKRSWLRLFENRAIFTLLKEIGEINSQLSVHGGDIIKRQEALCGCAGQEEVAGSVGHIKGSLIIVHCLILGQICILALFLF